MQITCFGFDWAEVRKRSSAEQIVEEMIHSDDIDKYSKQLPGSIWRSDSANQHFETAEILSKALRLMPPTSVKALEEISKLISNGDSIDELGLSTLTEGCYFISISPESVASLQTSFESLNVDTIPGMNSDAKEWITQWQKAFEFAKANGYGVIGHCG
jgi:hypothetical protein